MKPQTLDLIIAHQGRIYCIGEDELEESKVGYSPKQLDALKQDLPDPFLINFWWNYSARQIDEKEQRRIIEMIKKGLLDNYLV